MAAAAKHLTPVILELGGKCPAVVNSDINLKVIYYILLDYQNINTLIQPMIYLLFVLTLSFIYNLMCILIIQVACRRIIAGKWALNNGQACIAVDYIITTKEFAPKLVSFFLSTHIYVC